MFSTVGLTPCPGCSTPCSTDSASCIHYKGVTWSLSCAVGGNQDGKFSVGFRDGVVRTVVSLDRETVASYTLILEAIGKDFPLFP